MEMKTHKIRDTIFLFLTAMIWGAAFVAQSISMDYIGPFTFICLRSVIGGLFLIPVIMVIDNIRKKRRSESVKTASDNGINSFQKMQAEDFLENHLQADGSVTIPEVLQPYMGGLKVMVPTNKKN